jgi:DNA primase
MLDRCEEGLDLDTEGGKVELLKRVSRVLAGIGSPLEREVYISRTAKKCDISPEVLKSHINELLRMKKNSRKKEEWRNIKAQTTYVRDDVNPEAVRFRKEAKAEETIITYLLRRPEDAETISAAAPPEIFVTPFNKRVYTALLNAISESEQFTLSLIADEFTPQEMGRISGIIASNREFAITEKAMLDCAEALRRHKSDTGSGGDISDDDLRDLFSQKKH